jgi:hypothetical protein
MASFDASWGTDHVTRREPLFRSFSSIPRWSKGVAVSEKIDGTNAQIHIVQYGDEEFDFDGHAWLAIAKNFERDQYMLVASRNKYIMLDQDNQGFGNWCLANVAELWKLGPGRHYGEWAGPGIQKNPLNLEEKRLFMFNPKWVDQGPSCVEIAPVLAECMDAGDIDQLMADLKRNGTQVEGGKGQAEGVVIYHHGSGKLYKATYDNPEGKWNAV